MWISCEDAGVQSVGKFSLHLGVFFVKLMFQILFD
jgi:hypothetical protein